MYLLQALCRRLIVKELEQPVILCWFFYTSVIKATELVVILLYPWVVDVVERGVHRVVHWLIDKHFRVQVLQLLGHGGAGFT